MFKVKNKTFLVTRGDRGVVDLDFNDYTFQPGDTIEFKIYEENGLDQAPQKVIEYLVEEETELIHIPFESADTMLGEPSNEPIIYWYEIKLNGDQTIFCYDDLTGPKLFYLYPGGVDK